MAFVKFGKPDETELKRFVQTQRARLITHRGTLEARPGLTFRRTLEPLGDGPEVFARAVAGLQAWVVYPAWLTLYPNLISVRDGVVVALVAGISLIWTVSAVRVVAVKSTARRFSFTLATLPQHAVSGLERFSVFQDETEAVWYEILAVSKPRHLLVKLGAPVLRLVQRRFVQGSVRSLRRFVAQPLSS